MSDNEKEKTDPNVEKNLSTITEAPAEEEKPIMYLSALQFVENLYKSRKQLKAHPKTVALIDDLIKHIVNPDLPPLPDPATQPDLPGPKYTK